MVEGICYSKTR